MSPAVMLAGAANIFSEHLQLDRIWSWFSGWLIGDERRYSVTSETGIS